MLTGPFAAGRSSFLRLHLLCSTIFLSLHLPSSVLSATTLFRTPHLDYDINTAKIWKCFHEMESDSLQELIRGHRSGMEIIHPSMHKDWIEVISSSLTCKEDLFSLGLVQCQEIGPVGKLINREMMENWQTLRHHVATSSSTPPDVSLIKDELPLRRSGADEGDDDEDNVDQGGNGGEEYVLSDENRRVRRSSSNGVHEEAASGGSLESTSSSSSYAYDHYLNLSSLMDWYQQFASSHPSLVTLNTSIGSTHYKKDIVALHLTNKESLDQDDSAERPVVYIQCLMHSREWITGPVCMYVAEKLVEMDQVLGSQSLLHEIEVVIVPVVNPDGYYVTWYKYPSYRLWRKNVQPFEGTACAGVDLNRNFDSHWNAVSASQSDDPCREVYRGPHANSELEVQAIVEYLNSLGHRVIGAIDYHSYHQEILYPPAWSKHNPEDIDVIRGVAEGVATSASEVGATYAAHRMVDIYSASGTFADWLLDWRESGKGSPSLVPLTVELRPSIHNVNSTLAGFLLPASEILPTCQEMLQAFMKFTELVLDITSTDHHPMQGRP